MLKHKIKLNNLLLFNRHNMWLAADGWRTCFKVSTLTFFKKYYYPFNITSKKMKIICVNIYVKKLLVLWLPRKNCNNLTCFHTILLIIFKNMFCNVIVLLLDYCVQITQRAILKSKYMRALRWLITILIYHSLNTYAQLWTYMRYTELDSCMSFV